MTARKIENTTLRNAVKNISRSSQLRILDRILAAEKFDLNSDKLKDGRCYFEILHIAINDGNFIATQHLINRGAEVNQSMLNTAARKMKGTNSDDAEKIFLLVLMKSNTDIILHTADRYANPGWAIVGFDNKKLQYHFEKELSHRQALETSQTFTPSMQVAASSSYSVSAERPECQEPDNNMFQRFTKR